jgi:polyisoprenoid-binding protein YceI
LIACATRPALAESYSLSGENTKIKFTGSKKDGSHTGGFKKLSGKATAKGTDAETLALSVVIDVDSMFTDADKLTAHLKSPDFFEAKRYPEAKFESSEVKLTKNGHMVTGNLTIRGKSNKVSFPAEISVDSTGLKLAAKFKIDRNNWGISYGKGMINDDVDLVVDVSAKK